MTNNHKTQKILNFTCQECHSVYQLLEIHETKPKNSYDCCLDYWKQLLHSHYQEQIILYLAQKEKENDPDNHE